MAGKPQLGQMRGFNSGLVSSPRIMSGEVGSEGKDTPSESLAAATLRRRRMP